MSETLRIIKDTENPPLGRREVIFEIVHLQAATPKRQDVRKDVAARLNANQDLVFLMRMITGTNSWRTRGVAHAYHTADAANLYAPEYLRLRGLPKE
ncbi:MAG: 30S ribosomal protein S24e, partial [Candidatus Bathyarchaeia archaeon]